MDTIFPACNTLEDDRFESIEEFKDCIGRGERRSFRNERLPTETGASDHGLSLEPAGYRTIL